MITVHVVVRNEENFIYYALNSVIDYVDKIIIFDTGSTDKTVDIIKSIKSPKIDFKLKGKVDRKGLTSLRQEQIDNTQDDWIMVLDGDEIYPLKTIKEVINIIKNAPEDTLGVVVPFYNFAGDIFHVQPESRGKYQFGNKIGHLNLRVIKRTPDLIVTGDYPLESFKHENIPIQNFTDKLLFAENKFFHAGDIQRSHLDRGVMERKIAIELGLPCPEPLPEVFKNPPDFLPNVFIKRSVTYELMAFGKQTIYKLLNKR